MDDASLKRINELAKKKKTVGLTEEEQSEQKKLYRLYIDEMKSSLRSQLENTDAVMPDGKVVPLTSFKKNKDDK
ncbi:MULTISPECIES: DUF896 domain-containing protein [unclassified Ruminococcus]|uniref:DUF896 domain-containing protein n=1 Tax=unclassified Ruminococcus TaxID=2608920 RepID=UPI00210E32F2|nr:MULTISPECIES: DUF896 domain-containing protein [unclassified Ruminococcus]MCQ4022888.1 DUF896 domain-containing protein [Ruminococcus sp. zg-924]MCQ4115296.1 DUF896 domain-containing protein [Ruminococcus sp. zg-921]